MLRSFVRSTGLITVRKHTCIAPIASQHRSFHDKYWRVGKGAVAVGACAGFAVGAIDPDLIVGLSVFSQQTAWGEVINGAAGGGIGAAFSSTIVAGITAVLLPGYLVGSRRSKAELSRASTSVATTTTKPPELTTKLSEITSPITAPITMNPGLILNKIFFGDLDGNINVWFVGSSFDPICCVESSFDPKNISSMTKAHDYWVESLCVSPNKQMFASAGGKRKINVCSIDGKVLKQIYTDEWILYSATFSLDSKKLAVVDNGVKLFDLENNFASKTCLDEPVSSVHFTSTHLIAIDFIKRAHVIDLETNAIVKTFKMDRSTSCYVPHPNGKLLVSAGKDGSVLFWDIHQGQCIWGFDSCKGKKAFTCIVYNSIGNCLAAGSRDGSIVIWNYSSSETIDAGSEVKHIDFSPCGKYIVSGHDTNEVKIWDVQTRRLVQSISHSSSVRSIEWV